MNLWLGEGDRFTTYHTDIYTYVRDLFREEGGRLQMLIHILLHAGVFALFFPPLFWTATLWWYTSTSHTHLTQQPTCRSLIFINGAVSFSFLFGKNKKPKAAVFLSFFRLFLCCSDSAIFLFCSPPMIWSDPIRSTYLHIPYHYTYRVREGRFRVVVICRDS